jgi:hypothetical protein
MSVSTQVTRSKTLRIPAPWALLFVRVISHQLNLGPYAYFDSECEAHGRSESGSMGIQVSIEPASPERLLNLASHLLL